MSGLILGTVATAAMVAGVYKMNKKKGESRDPDLASPGWDDQTRMISGTDGTLGDVLGETDWTSGRNASAELELPPEHTKTHSCHPLEYGGQLMPHEMPHGAHEESYVQRWGDINWDDERHSKTPSYVHNLAAQLDGKEINRPLDDFGWQEFGHDSDFAGKGSVDVDYGEGQSSARTANVRLMQRNRYGRFVTTKESDRPKFLPPIPTKAGGGGQPGMEPDITFGARLNKVFSAFMGGRSAGCKAGPEFAQKTIETSKMLDYQPRLGNGRAPGGAQPSGPQVNPTIGGRIRREDDSLQLPMGNAKPKISAGSSLSINPYAGYHYTSREKEFTWEDNTIGKSRAGKNAYLLLGNPQLEYRKRKEPDDRQEYQAPRMGARGSIYGGERTHGIMIPNVKSSAVSDRCLGKGGRNMLGDTGIITLRSNIKNGLKGGDCDNTPQTYEGFIDLKTPRSLAVIGGRSEGALNDLFDVQHS